MLSYGNDTQCCMHECNGRHIRHHLTKPASGQSGAIARLVAWTWQSVPTCQGCRVCALPFAADQRRRIIQHRRQLSVRLILGIFSAIKQAQPLLFTALIICTPRTLALGRRAYAVVWLHGGEG